MVQVDREEGVDELIKMQKINKFNCDKRSLLRMKELSIIINSFNHTAHTDRKSVV